MSWALAAVAMVSLGVSSLAPFVFRPLLLHLGIMDVPNARSSHTRPTLRAGGLAPLAGWIAGVVLSIAFLPSDAWVLGASGAAAVALALLGFMDDLSDLSPRLKLGMQTAIALGAAIAGAAAIGVTTVAYVPLATLLIVGYVNTANFMDGINGLSGLHGAVVGLALAASGALSNTEWMTFIGIMVSVSFAAFLPWNLQKPGIFLGDVGSYLLGGSIAIAVAFGLGSGVSALLVVSPLAIYIADTVVTVVRRLVRGERIMLAHRTHAYQRLTDTGLSHFTTSLVVASFAVVTSLIGIVVWINDAATWLGWLLIISLCGVYISLPSWRGSRLPSATLSVPPAAEIPEIPASPDHTAERWAVLGSSGFVGSAVVERLCASGHDVVELTAPRLRLDSSSAVDSDALLVAARSAPEVAALATELSEVDVVVNAAGVASPDSDGGDDLYGANVLLPLVIAHASAAAGARRYIHLSTAAVQGRIPKIDASSVVAPFSPYSHSKALGERGLLALSNHGGIVPTVILRATSVQGRGRPTTETLMKLARSPLASVAAPGTAPSVVSSVSSLAATVVDLGSTAGPIPAIVLQPWEGLTSRRVLELASRGERTPLMLPPSVCRFLIAAGYQCSRLVPKVVGVIRRVEVMWFGQSQEPGWRQRSGSGESDALKRVFSGDRLPDEQNSPP